MRFTKLQGLGNDFLIIPVADVNQLDAPDRLAQQMCERHYGAGADGIVFVAPAVGDEMDVVSRIFNADGSEAEVSGNGTRCVAAYFYARENWTAPEIRIGTVAGVKVGRRVAGDADGGRRFDFEFAMGAPRLHSREIPIHLTPELERVVGYRLKMGGELQTITCVSMGNPHCSVFVQAFDDRVIGEMGPLLEDHPAFPLRTNVEFVRVIGRDEIEVRFWERGVGRTLSSGTGSCAAAVAAMLNGFTNRDILVNTQGGVLRVCWESGDNQDNQQANQVRLTGSAEVIYDGVWRG